MATATLLSGPTTDTGNTPNSSGSFTPTLNDLLVVIVTKEASALSSPIVSADLSCSAGTTFTLVRTQGFGASAHQLAVFVANAKSAASSQTVTLASGADAGGGTIIAVYGIAGMTFTGSSAIRQSGGETDQASGEVPSLNFGTGVALTGNLIIGTVGVVDNTPGLLAPASFQAVSEAGYTTGATQGISNTYRNSGHTSQTVAWQTNTTGGSYATIIVELDTSTGTNYTDRRLGQIDLTGTRRETHRYTERRSGQIDATGARRESNSQTKRRSGTIDITGSVREQHLVPVSYTDKPSGTISLLGTRRESLSHTDSVGGGAGASYEETVLALPNISLYWKLDAVDLGDDLADAHDGTASGPTFGDFADGPIVGEPDSSTYFDGTDDKVTSAYSPFTNGTTRTFLGWAYRDVTATTYTLFGGSTGDTPALLTDSGVAGNMRWFADLAGGGGAATTWTGVWTSGVWVFWALVFNETANQVSLYLDGDLVSTEAHAAPYNALPGNFQLGAWGGGGNRWNGKQAHVVVVEGDVTAEQIADLYDVAINGGAGGVGALITLSGTVSESWGISNTEKVTGTISLSGASREQNSQRAKPTGTVLLSGQARESHAISSIDRTTGTITITGTVSESWSTLAPISYTDSPTGQITLSGAVRESKTVTHRATGQITLSGSVRELWALGYTDRRSGQVDVSGTRRELSRQTPKPTGIILLSGTASDRYIGATTDRRLGQITLTGAIREQYLGATTDRVTGTITLSGATRESHAVSRTEKVIGTVQITGSLTDSFQISGGTQTVTPTGTIQILGTRRESQSQSVKTTGTVNISGQVRETFTGPSFSDSVTGTVALVGTWRESSSQRVLRTGTITVTGTVSDQYLGATTDRRSGQIILSGTQSDYWESTRTERRTGSIVISGQMWENYLPSGVTIDKRTGTIVLSGSLLDIHSRWDFVDGERWPGSTEDRWQEDVGERWNLDPVA